MTVEDQSLDPQSPAYDAPEFHDNDIVASPPTRVHALAAFTTWEMITWISFAIAGFVTRFWNLGARVMSHDESLHVFYSWQLSKGSGYAHNPMMHGPWLFESTALFQAIFGANDFTSRIVPALLGIAILVGAPLLLRPWLGRLGSLAAAALLLVSPYVLYYSRYIRHDIQIIAFSILAFWAILSYIRDRQEKYLYYLAAALALMLSTMEISFFYLAIFASAVAIHGLLRHGIRWSALRHAPEFDLVIVLATLGAFFSAPIALLAVNPIWQQITGATFVDLNVLDTQGVNWQAPPNGMRLWGLVGLFGLLATLIGLWWGRLRWLKLAGLFALIVVPMYTTFFTNWNGMGTGLVGSLGYWLSQHEVQRGNQPWYYYLIVFPLYEYLPILAGLGAVAYAALRFAVMRALDLTFLFLTSWWAALIWFGLSAAGEKMPWLSTHITVPFIFLAAWGIGRALSSFRRTEERTSAPIWAWVATAVTVVLLVMTARHSYIVNYVNYDLTTEFIGYAHGAPGVKWLMEDVESISERLGQGKEMPVGYDNDVAWPLAWYLRDYPGFFGAEPNRAALADTPIVVVGAGNWQKTESLLGSDYHRYEMVRIWWPMEEYKNLTWDRIRSALRDPEWRLALWDVFWNRDYTRYAALTGMNMDPPDKWVLEDRMRVYIRKDAAAQMESLALSRAQIEDVQPLADIYTGVYSSVQPINLINPGLDHPRALAFGPNGRLYAADSSRHRIVELDETGAVLNSWGSQTLQPPIMPGTFNEPWGIAVDGIGNVYVADTWNHRIQKFDPDGRFLLEWGVPGVSTEDSMFFWGPRGLAVGPHGSIYVTDTGNRRVAVFSPDGAFLFEFGLEGEGRLDEPVGIAIGRDGRVYVADTWNMRVAVFGTDGTYLNAYPVQAWGSASIENKPYIAVDDRNRVYLTDPEGYRVIVLADGGAPLKVFGQFGGEPDSFGLPNGIAISPDGELWIADAGNNRLAAYPLAE